MSVMKRAEAGRPWMPIDAFRSFQFDRPDEERWELIDGLPVMMTPTQIGHARIAGTIERLLSEALERFDPSRIALHDIGVELGLAEETLIGLGRSAGYAPQPMSASSMRLSTSTSVSRAGSSLPSRWSRAPTMFG